MVTAVRHGGSGGRPAPLFSLRCRRLLQAVLLLACVWTLPAQATNMYRCTGTSGETVFTTSKAGYRDCHRIRLADDKVSRHAPAAKKSASKAAAGWQYREGTAAKAPSLPAADKQAGVRVLRGAVYKVVHADGSIEYTNVRPRGKKARHARTRTLFTYIATCAACDVHSRIDWSRVPLRLSVYASAIRLAASRYGVDPALLRAIIHAESAFNPRAVSAKGAQGLMQLMPATASDMGVHDAFDATQNIEGGARYLAQLLKTFNGDDRLAAAAYNAGPDAVQKYGGVPPYAETKVYVQRVTTLHRRYRQAMQHNDAVASAGAGHAG
ncbi:lytic transglycosylase domain-containing protein [Oleiagrimonas citrea]|jgi:soluble lytic murein transglycosylase-like protein|uniref:Lytic transglycosylase domain-containing protein n=2 Tax=Oleiagrimonas citrea TaxID=1665687 RepID=A0A846ZJW2_9GAMM|nr:lytic transglycosylase domain-containing protein [Oleiagrimonas citrea]